MDNRIEICNQIAEDAKKDAADFDGQPFNGKTLGVYLGYHGASIAALADLIKSILEDIPSNGQNHKEVLPSPERTLMGDFKPDAE